MANGRGSLWRMRPLPTLAAAVLLGAAFACAHPAATPPARLEPSPAQRAARDTLLSADSALSVLASRSLHDAIAGGAADSLVMLMPALPLIEGRAHAVEIVDSLNAVASRTMSWRPIRAELSADGTRAYSYGYGRRVAGTDTLTSVVPIQYLSFWRRDGSAWKLAAWLVAAGGADAPAGAPAACAHPGAPAYIARADPTAAVSVREADLDFAALSTRSGAFAAFAAFVAEDGASIGTGATEITCGRDAVAEGLRPFGPGALTWAPVIADAAPSGDLAFTAGTATIRGERGLASSKYLTVWKRRADGAWRFVADGGNSAPPPAAP
jgi:ketosteroid isomerase-like protein